MKIRILALLVCIIVIFNIAGCGINKSTQSVNANDSTHALSKYTAPVTIKIGIYNPSSSWDMTKNSFIDLASDMLNIKVQAAWNLTWSDHSNKVNLAISTKSLPDAMVVFDLNLVKLMAAAGLIADLTPTKKYFGKWMNDSFSSFDNNSCLNSVTVNGKLYAIPSTGIRGQNSLLWIRKDWLDNVGLEVPKTLDDVMKVADAFVKSDPDGNGRNDTIGLPFDKYVWGGSNANASLDPILACFNAFPSAFYKDSSGKVIYGSIQPEMKTALKFIRDEVTAGIIDPNTNGTTEVGSGKCGIIFAPWWAPSGVLKGSRDVNPNADWISVDAPLNNNGKFIISDTSPTNQQSGYLVVRAGYEHPEAAIKLLNLFYDGTYVSNPDVLAQYKGDKDHLPSFGDVPLNIQIAKRDQVVDDYKTVNNYVEKGSSKGAPKIIATSVDHVLDWKKDPTSVDSAIWGNAMCVMVGAKTLLSTEIQYKLPCIFYLSSDQQTKFDSLRQYEDDTFFKIIADKGSNVDLFDTYVSQWKTLGGDAILSSISNTVK